LNGAKRWNDWNRLDSEKSAAVDPSIGLIQAF